MKHQPPLDGLRAIAILAVLAYHCFPDALSGFTGVDVFFVLSGYLITSVILYDFREGSFSLREFYLRRIQRLLPNAVAMILVTLATSQLLQLPSQSRKVAEHGFWTLFNLSNVYAWRYLGGYWGDSAESAPLLHTWSLAVEEQFYLLFPVALLLIVRWRRGNAVGAVALATLGSLALASYGTWNHPSATFYLLPTRAWEPLLGAILAAYRVPAARDAAVRSFGASRPREYLGWAGLAAVVVSALLMPQGLPFPGVVALVPTLGSAAMILSVADGGTTVARILSIPILTLVGRLSYSIYLWHWPGIVLGRSYAELIGAPPRAGALLGATVGVALAAISYRLVEYPLRKRGDGRKKRLLVIATSFSACVGVAVFSSTRPRSFDLASAFDPPSYDACLYDAGGNCGAYVPTRPISVTDVKVPTPQDRPVDSWRTGGIIHAWGGGPPRVVILGSSHSFMYGRVIDEICRDLGISVAFLGVSGASPFFGLGAHGPFLRDSDAREFDSIRRRWLQTWKPDLVIAGDRWDHHPEADTAGRLEAFADEMQRVTNTLVLVTQVPTLPFGQDVNLREYAFLRSRLERSLPRLLPDANELRRRNVVRAMADLAARRPGLRLLRADEPFYFPDGSVRYAEGRMFYYLDDDHLTEAGTLLVRDRFERTIAEVCGPPPDTQIVPGASHGKKIAIRSRKAPASGGSS